MRQTDRQLAIVLELETRGWQRAADLATTFGVSLRTIYRDMEALVEAGLPIEAVPGKGYRLYEGFFLPPLTLTSDEAVLVLLGTDTVADQLGVNYQAAARAVRAKVEAVLPDRLRSEVTTLQNSLRFVPVNAFDDPAEQQGLQVLRQALTEQRAVRFRYEEGGASADHVVNPYGLIHLGGAWHLVGLSHSSVRVQHVPVRSLATLAVLDETFERPRSYASSPQATVAQRDVVVRVRFDATVAHWVREAPSAYITETGAQGDALLVTLRVQRETEVLPWLLSWGAHAHVLEPASLQRRLAREAEKMAMQYQVEPTLLP